MLDYFGISYDIVEVNPVLRTQLKWSEKYRKVPILIVETPQGEVLQLNDSSMIISALFSYLQNLSKPKSESDSMLKVVKCYPTVQFAGEDGKMQTEIMNKYFIMNDMEADSKEAKQAIIHERKWRKWADSVYVHTLSPNIYRTLPEAVDSFKNFDRVGEWEKNFASWERALVIYVGAVAMWVIGKRLQKRHHLKPDVRQSLYEESDFWLQSIRKNGKGDFMGGAKPNLSDLAVYGVLNSIEGCEAFDDLAKNSRIISQWYRKVQQHLKNAPNKVEIYV
jgi:microsomal prostaglandin-E synthase 2